MNRKHLRARILPLAVAALMVFSLTACRDPNGGLTTDDAKDCVQVELDTTYKGDFAGFVDFYSNVTTSDARDQYDANIEGEASFFLYSLGPTSLEDEDTAVDPTELQLHRAKELYKQIYAKSDYTVASSSKQDDGTFAVKVTMKPIDLITPIDSNYEEFFDPFWEKFDAVDTDSMSDDEFTSWYTETFAREYYDTLLDLLEAQIPDLEYKDEKSIVIQVQQSEDGSLYISNEDWQNLDKLVIDYSGS